MARKIITVFGIFDTESSVRSAIERFKSEGFRSEDISCLMPKAEGPNELGMEKSTKSPEGAAAGTATGAIIGGTLGWLTGIGALAIPGVGPFIAAGPIMALLAGLGAGAAVGGITGALAGLGIPEFEAKRYESLVKQGKILVSVFCDNSEAAERAKFLMKACNAEGISTSTEVVTEDRRDVMPPPSIPTSVTDKRIDTSTNYF